MSRLILATAVAVALHAAAPAADDKPSYQETLDYILAKVNVGSQWHISARHAGAPPAYITFSVYFGKINYYHISSLPGAKEEDEVVGMLFNEHSPPDPTPMAPKPGYTARSSPRLIFLKDLKDFDPDSVRVEMTTRLNPEDDASAPLSDPVYRVVANKTVKDRGQKLAKPELELWLAREKSALSVAKALRAVLREAGGKAGVGRRTDIFEDTDGEKVTARQTGGRASPAAAPPVAGPVAPAGPAAVEALKPVGNEQRVAARKYVERVLLDAETELAAATQLDAANRAANDAKRAALRKQLDGLNAEAKQARADGQTAKATLAVVAGLTVIGDLSDEYKWAKDTGAAARVQGRVTSLRAQLIDLRD